MEILTIVGSALGAAGISALIIGVFLKNALNTTINEVVGNIYKKKLEDHKFLLKNSELVFKFKLDASKSLFKILHDILPRRSNPDMDWEDACEEIASSFSQHEEALYIFLCEYQATLSTDILIRVKSAITACSEGRFEFDWDSSGQSTVPSKSGKEKADELYKVLNEAVEILRAEVFEMIALKA